MSVTPRARIHLFVLFSFVSTGAGSPYVAGSLHNAVYSDDSESNAFPWAASEDGVQWKELTKDGNTGLIGGILRLPPGVNIRLHYHQLSFGESYYFTRGDRCQGFVHVGEVVKHDDPSAKRDSVVVRILRQYSIRVGLFVNIPAGAVHGITVPSHAEEPCEFVWHFPTVSPQDTWRNIAYLYVDPRVPARNVEGEENTTWYHEYSKLKIGKRKVAYVAADDTDDVDLSRLQVLDTYPTDGGEL
eukprot:TRINITY_DN45764_c0_g1_i1.p1 TRINITY_DN45764_c0_g1~~TRINITY_DN45764_c0_g1_i1.p1  ORF type:complete len:243 (+),score=18.46 TRINITY_DN45764_c0_g1_i1:49-777(+)